MGSNGRQVAGSYLRACLLLLLAERPAHGYELSCRLESLGLPSADATTTYRALRCLEGDGAVVSAWAPSAAGPARRVYHLTDAGRSRLAACCEEMRVAQVRAARYLQRVHDNLGPRPAARPAHAASSWPPR